MFLFTVVDKDGAETFFEIHTDKEIVGDALEELRLLSGEESPYGLFVKSVNVELPRALISVISSA